MEGLRARGEYARRMNSALRYIELHYPEDIALEDIAQAAAISPFHFHRIFSCFVGESPGEYLRRIRLEKAAVLLRLYGDRTITRIALETGFSSSAVFARAFKRHFNATAREFRAMGSTAPSRALAAHDSSEASAAERDEGSGYWKLDGIARLPAYRLAFVRSMEGYGPQVGKAWRRLFSLAYQNGLVDGGTRFFGIPMDDPLITQEGKCRYFAAMTIAAEEPLDEEAESMELKNGQYATFRFKGKAAGIEPFYRYVYGTWLPESGYKPGEGPALEEYPRGGPESGKSSPRDGSFDYVLLLPIQPL